MRLIVFSLVFIFQAASSVFAGMATKKAANRFIPTKRTLQYKKARIIHALINSAGKIANASKDQELIKAVQAVQKRWVFVRFVRRASGVVLTATEGAPHWNTYSKKLYVGWITKDDVKKYGKYSANLISLWNAPAHAGVSLHGGNIVMTFSFKKNYPSVFKSFVALHEFLHVYRVLTKKDVTLRSKRGKSKTELAIRRAYEEAYVHDRIMLAMKAYFGKPFVHVMKHAKKEFMKAYWKYRAKKIHHDDHGFFHHLMQNMLRWNKYRNYFLLKKVLPQIAQMLHIKTHDPVFGHCMMMVYIAAVCHMYRVVPIYGGKGYQLPNGGFMSRQMALTNFMYSARLYGRAHK